MNTFNEYLVMFFFFFVALVGAHIAEILYKGFRDFSIMPSTPNHENSIFPFMFRLAIYAAVITLMFHLISTYIIH